MEKGKWQKTGQIESWDYDNLKESRGTTAFPFFLLFKSKFKKPIYFHMNHLFPLKDSKIEKQLIMIFRS